mmetsp:Transcript_45694/g.120432  ORF Transcript_45694/g.120432 Transcript_45694/m.120432 type:complete len:253 (-) Transcript_45694:301-1059(-)
MGPRQAGPRQDAHPTLAPPVAARQGRAAHQGAAALPLLKRAPHNLHLLRAARPNLSAFNGARFGGGGAGGVGTGGTCHRAAHEHRARAARAQWNRSGGGERLTCHHTRTTHLCPCTPPAPCPPLVPLPSTSASSPLPPALAAAASEPSSLAPSPRPPRTPSPALPHRSQKPVVCSRPASSPRRCNPPSPTPSTHTRQHGPQKQTLFRRGGRPRDALDCSREPGAPARVYPCRNGARLRTLDRLRPAQTLHWA